MNKRIALTILSSVVTFKLAFAHQPVMDMAPRWQNGYGFQVRYESYGSDELFDDDSEIENPFDLDRYVERTWFEGVYTFDRSKRVTLKLPYVKQRRRVLMGGTPLRQRNEGIGDLILGVPLKLYKNKGAMTGNFGFTPSLRAPSGSTSGDFPISDGSWDLGLSLSHSAESPMYYSLVDLFYWFNTNGTGERREGNELGLDVNLGIHPFHDNESNSGMFLMLDVSARHNERGDSLTTGASGGERVGVGPVLVLYRDNVMFRAEYKFPAYENMIGTSLSRGQEYSVGIGVTF